MSPDAFHQLADLLPEPHWLVSGNGIIIAANPATRDRLCLSPDALQGRPLLEAVTDPPEEVTGYLRRCGRSRQLVLGALTVVGAPPLACRSEGALIHPTGEEVSILLRLVPKQSAVGQFVALNQRIEELGKEMRRRRHAERLLSEERERLRITLSSIGDAVISTDAEGRVTFLNGVAEKLTGWSQAEAVGRPLPLVFHIINEHTRLPAKNPAQRALHEGTVVGLANHTLLVARDGTERPIDDSAAPIQDGAAAPVGAVLVFRDITERKRAEEARARLAAIIESSADAIISKSLDGTILTWNQGANRLFGYTTEEAVGQPITLIIPPDRQEEEHVFLEKLRCGESIEHFETIRIDKHGQTIEISLTISPIRDHDGRVIGASKVARNITARKRAEAALRESEGRHRVLADLAAATLMLTDPAEIMVVAARLLAELLGADRCAYAEVEGESVYVITGDYAVGVPSVVGRWPVAAFGKEHLLLMRANQPFVVEDADTDPRIKPEDLAAYRATNIKAVICVPLHKGGKFTAAMAVHQKTPRGWTPAEIDLVSMYVGRCQEVLERAVAERALAASRNRLDYAAQVAGIGFWYCDLPFDVLVWDERVKEHFWLPPDAVVTIHTFYDQLHHDDRERTRAAIAQSINNRVPYDIQYRTVDPTSGRVKWIRALGGAAYGPDGQPTRFDGVTVDVTDQRRAEDEARASEERAQRAAAAAVRAAEANAKFRAFFEQGTNFAGVLALEGTVIEANRVCLEACGFTRDQVIGKPFWECGWWRPSAALAEMVRSACLQAAGGRQFRMETNFFVADGSERVVDLILAPVKDETGRVLFIAATGTDITERKAMEDALREGDRKKDDFIALLAHELRNPLAPIRNGLQVMRLAKDTMAVTQARDMMDRQLSHMVRLIDDLLDISRINRNKMELRRAPVQLADVIHNAVETVHPVIDAEGHELTVALPQKPIYLVADLTRLAQVFSNLLTNSAKYTLRGGRIWLSAERRGNEVRVRVRDTGIGIPAWSLEKIFDMFSQVDRSIERSTGGLGIGLALVKGLVEMHGGTIAAASEGEGKGSTFTVTLPILGEPPTSDVHKPDNRLGLVGPQRRVLIVDDNRDGADSLALLLGLMNNEVRIAQDGIEAVEQAEAFRPDVILMDVGMPRLNGLDSTRQIRAQHWGRDMTIIALTGWGQEGDKEESRAAGCNGHLVKPVSLPDLQKLLRELPETAV